MKKKLKDAIRTTIYLTRTAIGVAKQKAQISEISVSEYLESLVFKDLAESSPSQKLINLEAKERELQASLDIIRDHRSQLIGVLELKEKLKVNGLDLENQAIERIKKKINNMDSEEEVLKVASHFAVKLGKEPLELVYRARKELDC